MKNLKDKIRDIYILKRYGSFFHKIMEKKFIYDRTPEIKIREKNFEIIADIMIDIYENEDKYRKLPKELEFIDLFMKKYNQIEDKLLSSILDKDIALKENENYQNYYKNEIETLKIVVSNYETDLNYIKNEFNKVRFTLKDYKICVDDIFDNYMKYIIELGKEIETNIKIPKIMENKNISDFVLFSKNILKLLGNIEDIINTNIFKIEDVLNNGEKEDIELMIKSILNQKNKCGKERKLIIKEKLEKMKEFKYLKVIKKAKKIVLTGRKIILDYPINNNKYNIKKIIKKENNDNDLQYPHYNSD